MDNEDFEHLDINAFERLGITAAQAAALTGLSRQAIYRLVSSGEIESTRLGGRILILFRPFKRKFGL